MVNSSYLVGLIQNDANLEQFAQAQKLGELFINTTGFETKAGYSEDIGTLKYQYDKLKANNVAQFIALMDVVMLKMCTRINSLLIKLIESPNTCKYENKIIECACVIARHHDFRVIQDKGEPFPNDERC